MLAKIVNAPRRLVRRIASKFLRARPIGNEPGKNHEPYPSYSGTKKLDGKIALVTGGTTGIGLATARRFVSEGAHVIITGRRKDILETAANELGAQVIGIQADAGKLDDLDRLYAQISDKYGYLDIVFANAGIAEFAAIDQASEEHFDKIFDINVKGVFFTVQKALPLMKPGGAIVLSASVVASKGMPSFGVYSASKAAVRSFARTWTNDLKDRRIRVNAVSAGTIDTPGLDGLMGSPKEAKHMKEYLASQIPLGRLGEPDEIAKAVVFLVSDDASFIAGIELFVDGGSIQV